MSFDHPEEYTQEDYDLIDRYQWNVHLIDFLALFDIYDSRDEPFL
jgi:hypothetical protein